MALRVPVAIVSLLDLSFITTKEVTIDAINRTFVQASAETLKGIVGVTDEPLVSSDFRGNSHSVIIDSQLTSTCGPAMGKVFGWYDNEWGYSARLKDFLISVVGRSM
jgi:glyceraldehyde 3-phosphate dehydrogenase